MRRRVLLQAAAAGLIVACAPPPARSAPTPPSASPSPAATRSTPPSAPTGAPVPSATAIPRSRDLLYIRDDYGVTGPGQMVVVDSAADRSIRQLPIGLPAPDWSALYNVQWSDAKTLLRAVDPATGAVARQATLDDTYDLAGISPGGKWLALRWVPSRQESKAFQASGKWTSRYVVLDSTLATRRKPIALDGDFSFDAIGDDGTALFLIENLPAAQPGSSPPYQVRLYDLAAGALQPGVIADKTGSEVMSGYRQSSVLSPDRQWLYTLYLNTAKGPFVHALNLAQRYAVCIFLPTTGKEDYEKQLLWSLAMTGNGRTLYAANGALGIVAVVDLARLAIERTAQLPVAAAAPPSPLARLASWILPIAEAKRALIGGAALTPDERTLLAIGDKGLLAIDTGALALRGRYLPDWTLDSLAPSPDGTRLYVVDAELATVLALDPATGETLATIHGPAHPWAVLRVVTAAG